MLATSVPTGVITAAARWPDTSRGSEPAGARLGIAVGGIGPTRSRCLDKMRRHPAIAALIDAEPSPPRPVTAADS